jgi:[ribosomal protein S18]-alanine N-acetyltransferase
VVALRVGAQQLNTLPLTPADLDAVLQLEHELYPQPWTHGNFLDALRAGDYAQQLRHPETHELVGYVLAQPGVDEVHLLNLGVRTSYQRQGWAQRLLQDLAQWARDQNAACVWLEVRVSNHAALALYEHMGFAPVSVRRRYYPGPEPEDAQVMRWLP